MHELHWWVWRIQYLLEQTLQKHFLVFLVLCRRSVWRGDCEWWDVFHIAKPLKSRWSLGAVWIDIAHEAHVELQRARTWFFLTTSYIVSVLAFVILIILRTIAFIVGLRRRATWRCCYLDDGSGSINISIRRTELGGSGRSTTRWRRWWMCDVSQ